MIDLAHGTSGLERHDLVRVGGDPVKLYNAVRRQSVSFNQLDERNMARIRYRKVNAETGRR